MHILLVDDDSENCLTLADVLRAEGYSIDTASDGYEALEIVGTKKFDAIVSDALMPRMDGFVLCRTLRGDDVHRDIPFIILTGEYVDNSDIQFAMNLGASKVLQKTGNIDELLETLGQLREKPENLNSDANQAAAPAEGQYLKEYNTVLVRKLEAKMSELENVNRKLIERNAQLEYERRRYKQLFLSANDGIILVSQVNGIIVEANAHAKKILKLGDKNISKLRIDELKPFGELLFEKVLHGEPVQFEATYDNGVSDILVDVGGSPIGTEERLYLIILRNVTRRREWLERFISLDKLRALGRLSHGLVHEIRNPLNVVSVNLQYLDRSLGEGSLERKFARHALEGVTAIEKVIRETMSFAQPQTPAKLKFKLGGILAEIAALAKTSLQKSKINLDIEKSEIDDVIFADKSQVLHAILNIVENAIEAMPNGGKLKFSLEGSGDSDEIILRIADTGVGMDDDVARLATEPFYTTREGATGMGLSISNRLFELNGASLSCESKPGAGTTVTIRFQKWR